MHITLNIGLEVSKHYAPEGAAKMHLHYQYVEAYLNATLGTPIYIVLHSSATEKTVVAEYENVHLVLRKLFWLAHEFKQDCIAYAVTYGGQRLGGALVGAYAHEWNYGIVNEAEFIQLF